MRKCVSLVREVLCAPNFAVRHPFLVCQLQCVAVESNIETERLSDLEAVTLERVAEILVVTQPVVERIGIEANHSRLIPAKCRAGPAIRTSFESEAAG